MQPSPGIPWGEGGGVGGLNVYVNTAGDTGGDDIQQQQSPPDRSTILRASFRRRNIFNAYISSASTRKDKACTECLPTTGAV